MSTQAISIEPVRRWRLLRPHALRPGQFGVALGLLAAWLLLLAAAALGLGYWPVALFCVLVLGATVTGFWHAAWHALDGETIALHADGTVEVRVARGMALSRHRFAAAWLRVEQVPAGVRLSSHGRRVLVGTQVGQATRQRLARELRAALCAAPAPPESGTHGTFAPM